MARVPADIPHQEFSHGLLAATAATDPKSGMPCYVHKPVGAGVSHGREGKDPSGSLEAGDDACPSPSQEIHQR